MDFDFSVAAIAFGPPAILLFVGAVVLDLVLGGTASRRLPLLLRPIPLIERVAAELERRLNRKFRSAVTRLIRGLILLLVLAAPLGTAGFVVEHAANTLPFVWFLELGATVAFVAPRQPLDCIRAATRGIARGDLAAAREAARPIIGGGVGRMDRLQLSASLIPRMGEHIMIGFVAPAFWFVLLGLSGCAMYRAVGVVAALVARDEAQTSHFGFAAIRLHEAIALIPAFISGLLLTLGSALAPQARPAAALMTVFRWPLQRPISRHWSATVIVQGLGIDAMTAVDAGQSATLLNRAAYLYALSIGIGTAALMLVTVWRLAD